MTKRDQAASNVFRGFGTAVRYNTTGTPIKVGDKNKAFRLYNQGHFNSIMLGKSDMLTTGGLFIKPKEFIVLDLPKDDIFALTGSGKVIFNASDPYEINFLFQFGGKLFVVLEPYGGNTNIAFNSGMFISTKDFGETWEVSFQGFSKFGGMTYIHGRLIFAAGFRTDDFNLMRVYTSDDLGTTWIRRETPLITAQSVGQRVSTFLFITQDIVSTGSRGISEFAPSFIFTANAGVGTLLWSIGGADTGENWASIVEADWKDADHSSIPQRPLHFSKEAQSDTFYFTAVATSISASEDVLAIYQAVLKEEVADTAQAGTANTITLHAGASASNDFYNGMLIRIHIGTGADQTRLILDYDGTTKIATVEVDWTINPDATSEFAIFDLTVTLKKQLTTTEVLGYAASKFSKISVVPIYKEGNLWIIPMGPGNRLVAFILSDDDLVTFTLITWPIGPMTPALLIRTGTAQAGGASTITLDAGADATDGFYQGRDIKIISGAGVGQSKKISEYVGASKVATVLTAWTTVPNATSVFEIFDANEVVFNTLGRKMVALGRDPNEFAVSQGGFRSQPDISTITRDARVATPPGFPEIRFGDNDPVGSQVVVLDRADVSTATMQRLHVSDSCMIAIGEMVLSINRNKKTLVMHDNFGRGNLLAIEVQDAS